MKEKVVRLALSVCVDKFFFLPAVISRQTNLLSFDEIDSRQVNCQPLITAFCQSKFHPIGSRLATITNDILNMCVFLSIFSWNISRKSRFKVDRSYPLSNSAIHCDERSRVSSSFPSVRQRL
jgi:hypothetical protein